MVGLHSLVSGVHHREVFTEISVVVLHAQETSEFTLGGKGSGELAQPQP